MLLDGTDWFQNEEIRITDVSKLDSEDMLEQLRNVVDRTSGRSLLIVIHGFRERFSSALRKTAFIASVLDIDTPGTGFRLACEPGLLAARIQGRPANSPMRRGADLARALEVIVSEIQPDNLALVANSNGWAKSSVSAFNLLYENPDFADSDVEIDHVVLTAPDVDHTAFNEQFKHEIKAFAKDLTVYVSSNDRALLVSRLINREQLCRRKAH